MNRSEALLLCRYVSGACPQQRFDEYTPDAWHDLMADLPFAVALAGARHVAQQQPFVAPSEIRRVVRRMRVVTRRAIKRAARAGEFLVNVEHEADLAIADGTVRFDGIDLMVAEGQDVRFYRPEVAQLAGWVPARKEIGA